MEIETRQVPQPIIISGRLLCPRCQAQLTWDIDGHGCWRCGYVAYVGRPLPMTRGGK